MKSNWKHTPPVQQSWHTRVEFSYSNVLLMKNWHEKYGHSTDDNTTTIRRNEFVKKVHTFQGHNFFLAPETHLVMIKSFDLRVPHSSIKTTVQNRYHNFGILSSLKYKENSHYGTPECLHLLCLIQPWKERAQPQTPAIPCHSLRTKTFVHFGTKLSTQRLINID
jgi:hypothetical protein